jgi:hypothetical protein
MICRAGTVLTVLMSLAGCGASEARYAADLPADVPARSDAVRPEEVAGDLGPRSFPCPGDAPVVGGSRVLPRPYRVVRWDTAAALALPTVGWSGATEDEADVLTALAVAKGLTPAGLLSDAGLRVQLHDSSDWESMVSACGLESDAVEGSYFLDASVSNGAGEVHILAGDAAGRHYGLMTLAQLLDGEGPALTGAAMLDRPAITLRGFIEGFYGAPWSPEARLAMVAEAAALKMNLFVYAPKGEAAINTGWMLPFGQEDLAHLKELAEAGRRNHVRVCFEMHPSWALHYSSQADIDTLVGKFDAAIAQGIDCVVLAFDDVSARLIPPDTEVYASYTEAQADFVPKVGAALKQKHPDLLLGYVPVEYYTNHPNAAVALPEFAKALDPGWLIAWTGTEIGCTATTLAHAQEAAGLMGRLPLLGDNYPVSDDASTTGVVHLGPLKGRAPDLVNGLSGIAFNAMPLPYSSLPALATAADYAWNPAAYDPLDSLARAAAVLGGKHGAAALETLCLANRSTLLEGSVAPELDAALAAYWQKWEAVDTVGPEAKVLEEQFFEKYSEAASGLWAPGAHAGIAGELAQWADKLAGYGEAGTQALHLLDGVAKGGSVPAGDVQALAQAAAALAALLPKPTGPAMDGFLSKAVEILQETTAVSVELDVTDTGGYDDFSSPGAALGFAVDADAGWILVAALKFELPMAEKEFVVSADTAALLAGYDVKPAPNVLADAMAKYPVLAAAVTDTEGIRTMASGAMFVLLRGDVTGAAPEQVFVAHAGLATLLRLDGPEDVLEGALSFVEVTGLGDTAAVVAGGDTVDLAPFSFTWSTAAQP